MAPLAAGHLISWCRNPSGSLSHRVPGPRGRVLRFILDLQNKTMRKPPFFPYITWESMQEPKHARVARKLKVISFEQGRYDGGKER
jgi:hypothetical protein